MQQLHASQRSTNQGTAVWLFLFELGGKTPVVFVVFRTDWFLPLMDQVVIALPASHVALA